MADTINASSLRDMIDECNRIGSSAEPVETEMKANEGMQVTMFVIQGRFGQAMSLVEHALTDMDTVARLQTVVDPKDNKIWLEVDTEDGIHARMDALPLSVPLEHPVYVRIYDICNAVGKLMGARETSVAFWESEGMLYLGAYFNDKIGGFELEVGFQSCKPFDVVRSDAKDYSIRIAMDQIAINTVLDSVYNFNTVEIHRKNGRVSYRTGDEHCTIATAMQNAVAIKEKDVEEDLSDFSVSLPAKVFKAIPLVNALDLDIVSNVVISINKDAKKVKITGTYAELDVSYGDSTLATYTNEGLVPVFRIRADSVSAAIGTYFDINHRNPTGKARIYGIEEGLIGIEGMEDENIRVNLTVGDCHVEKEGFEFVLPLDVFTMMVRNAGCPELVMQHGFENGRSMMTYGNGMFLRKCTYNV